MVLLFILVQKSLQTLQKVVFGKNKVKQNKNQIKQIGKTRATTKVLFLMLARHTKYWFFSIEEWWGLEGEELSVCSGVRIGTLNEWKACTDGGFRDN